MKIAVPTSETPHEAVHGHVATAPYFTVVDLDTDETRQVTNPLFGKEARAINPVGVVRDLGVEAILCGGIGRWAVKMLETAGIKVYKAHGGSVAGAIEDFRRGLLRPMINELDE